MRNNSPVARKNGPVARFARKNRPRRSAPERAAGCPGRVAVRAEGVARRRVHVVGRDAADVHDLVVAQEAHDGAAGAARGDRERVQQCQARGLGVAAAEDVAELHEGRVAADPVAALADEAARPERRAEGLDVAVHVPDGDDAALGGDV